MYLTPGPGPQTYAVISNLESGKSDIVVRSDGNPESLRWCNYSAPAAGRCAASARNVDTLGYLDRDATTDRDGHRRHQREAARSAGAAIRTRYLRQFDAAVLDWRNRPTASVLMEREYVPEAGKIGTNIVDSREGLGVDLVDTAHPQKHAVERPNAAASGYLTDGRGHVRIMAVTEDDHHGRMSRLCQIFYRTQNSRDWKTLVEFQKEQFEPLDVDADTRQRLRAQEEGRSLRALSDQARRQRLPRH